MKKYFKCFLKTDIVINASLATEGNMKTLDYIPGSNFLGIVAKDYDKWKGKKQAYTIFHSGDISFGDAHLAKDKCQSYALPFSIFTDKLDPKIRGEKANVWLHHALLAEGIYPKEKSGNPIQLKQKRSGYINKNGGFIPKVEKRFALKSAQDRTNRKSLDGAMYGFESMKAGQEFIFSLHIKNEALKEDHIEELIETLTGDQRIGKSKSAQYGQVNIQPIDPPKLFENEDCQNGRLLIYAESNLCFYNKYGQPTFQPTPKDFGLEEGKGAFDWAASQIRTYSYSPWNGHRNTTDPQRDCILKGSVLVFKFDDTGNTKIPSSSSVGSFQSEGLGRLIFNPEFLKAKDGGRWGFLLEKEEPTEEQETITPNENPDNYQTDLGKFLLKKYLLAKAELAIGRAVQEFINGKTANGKTHSSIFKDIPTSQWGGIRSKATKTKNTNELIKDLFGEKGILTTGVSADRYWNKRGGLARNTLQKNIQKNNLGNIYVVKLAAEMTQWKQRYDKSQIKETTTS